ncbi:hypothetical protein MEZE111188_21770 [Mesobacillus zeae]
MTTAKAKNEIIELVPDKVEELEEFKGYFYNEWGTLYP